MIVLDGSQEFDDNHLVSMMIRARIIFPLSGLCPSLYGNWLGAIDLRTTYCLSSLRIIR